MSVKIGKGGAAQAADISAIEGLAGLELSISFKSFLAEHDGAEPETNIFRINDANDSGVNRFIPVRQFLSERERVTELPPSTFPIAWAEGGNYVLIDLAANEAVLFWDHETAELTKLANDFDGFLAILKPFSVDDVELKPGQVQGVWVDPEFLKDLED